MDDTQRTLEITIHGESYPAAPISEGQVIALTLIKSVQPAMMMQIITGVLKHSLGEKIHDRLVIGLATGEVSLKDLIGGLQELAEVTSKDKEASLTAIAAAGAVPAAGKPRGGK